MEKKKNSKNKNYYFTNDTQEALLKYVDCEDKFERDQLFRKQLYYPLFKLTEGLINTYKFYYISETFEEIQQMGIEFILKKIKTHPIDPQKGKAFSYLTKITLNFYIQENRKAYKELTRYRPLNPSICNKPDEGPQHEKIYFFDFMQDYLVVNNHILFKDDEYDIANAILIVMKTRHRFENLNKKKLYMYVKEMLNLSSNFRITQVRKKMEVLYNHLYEKQLKNQVSLTYIPNKEIFDNI